MIAWVDPANSMVRAIYSHGTDSVYWDDLGYVCHPVNDEIARSMWIGGTATIEYVSAGVVDDQGDYVTIYRYQITATSSRPDPDEELAPIRVERARGRARTRGALAGPGATVAPETPPAEPITSNPEGA